MSYHVQRNGKAIGHYDEQTLHALLNAGTLRTTDTYWARGMSSVEPLVGLLGTGSTKSAWLPRLLVAVTGVALFTSLVWAIARQQRHPPMISADGSRPGPVEEVLKGYPVLVGTLTASFPHALPAFPFQNVENRAKHGRVAVLALDEKQAPLNFGAGFLTQDGIHVVTALPLVSGASSVEIWFENGLRTLAVNVLMDSDAGVAVLGTAQPGVGLDWAGVGPASGEELFVAGTALLTAPLLAHVQALPFDGRHLLYHLDHDLPRAFAGAAVLNASGEVWAVVIQPGAGALMGETGIRALLEKDAPLPISALAGLAAHSPVPAVMVDSAAVEEGELVMQLRNTSGHAVERALLHVRYHELPQDAAETASLERQLAATAVEACTLEIEAPASDRYFQKKQELREVTSRLEASRRLALNPSRQSVYRTDMVTIETTLPPGLPQRLSIATEAGSNWGAVVTVLEVLE
ncbi:MAG: hypothetical protein JWO94_152 [Verrucomicrobiaceae bacterium]|nr:hypothetical protein [Verrucomicrobiaceae bacterium]